jgi:subtilase family serine protease
VAIVDAWQSPTLVPDAQQYALQFDPQHLLQSTQITAVCAPSDCPLPTDPNVLQRVLGGWYFEQGLDVEAVHAMAPGADILYVGGATDSNGDMIAAINWIVQDRRADLISLSWGSLENGTGLNDDGHDALDPILLCAALKGIGIYAGTGDAGDFQAFGGPPTVSYPASSPYVTAVSGTSIALKHNGALAFETAWESGYSSATPDANGVIQWVPPPPGLFGAGGGGGPSGRYPQPRYQRERVPPALAGSPAVRVLPDVAMFADFNTGFYEGITDPFGSGVYEIFGNGGTSLSTPLFAASMALVQQRAGHRIGFANPRLYHSKHAFRDIVPPEPPIAVNDPAIPAFSIPSTTVTLDPANLQVAVGVLPDGITLILVPHTLHSAVGFDDETGLGAPAGERFLDLGKEE